MNDHHVHADHASHIPKDQPDPDHRIKTLLMRCRRHGEADDYEQAEAEATAAIHLAPSVSEAYYLRGHARYCRGQYEQAVADYTQAIRLKPDSANALFCRANSLHHLGRADEAFRDYTACLEIDLIRSDAFVGRGAILAAKGEYDKAIEEFDAALLIDPDCVEAEEGLVRATAARDREGRGR